MKGRLRAAATGVVRFAIAIHVGETRHWREKPSPDSAQAASTPFHESAGPKETNSHAERDGDGLRRGNARPPLSHRIPGRVKVVAGACRQSSTFVVSRRGGARLPLMQRQAFWEGELGKDWKEAPTASWATRLTQAVGSWSPQGEAGRRRRHSLLGSGSLGRWCGVVDSGARRSCGVLAEAVERGRAISPPAVSEQLGSAVGTGCPRLATRGRICHDVWSRPRALAPHAHRGEAAPRRSQGRSSATRGGPLRQCRGG
jgi:hypothetical protein